MQQKRENTAFYGCINKFLPCPILSPGLLAALVPAHAQAQHVTSPVSAASRLPARGFGRKPWNWEEVNKPSLPALPSPFSVGCEASWKRDAVMSCAYLLAMTTAIVGSPSWGCVFPDCGWGGSGHHPPAPPWHPASGLGGCMGHLL